MADPKPPAGSEVKAFCDVIESELTMHPELFDPQTRPETEREGKASTTAEPNVEIPGIWRKLSTKTPVSELDDLPVRHWRVYNRSHI